MTDPDMVEAGDEVLMALREALRVLRALDAEYADLCPAYVDLLVCARMVLGQRRSIGVDSAREEWLREAVDEAKKRSGQSI